jgi:NADPH-dependent 2,4-dienoyl-CoA reductase/sulfur reductase-like enzyme
VKRESIDSTPADRRSVRRHERANLSAEQDDEGPASKNRRSYATAQNESPWHAFEMPEYPLLREDVHADVCVVGAGIAGLSTAYLLAQAGQSSPFLTTESLPAA